MIARFLQAIIRFTYSFENLGMISSIKIIWFRILKKNINVKISTKKFGEVFWNTKRDWVITHFYTPQIEIFSPNNKIEVNLIVDLGANIGIETLRFAKLYPKAKIFSIEAVKENFETLIKNTKNMSNVTSINAAIWDKNSKLKIIKKSESGQARYIQEVRNSDKFHIRGMPFNKILSAYSIKGICILKIDIEGAERKLFNKSCKNWLHLVKCIIMEVPDSDFPFTTQKILKLFIENNYKFNTYINGENLIFIRSDINWKPRSIINY
jgi:FkbM family methyltransferase